MKKTVIYTLLLGITLFLFGCPINKKTDPDPKKEQSFVDKIILTELIPNQDSTQIVLNWTKLDNSDFVRYVIYRTQNKDAKLDIQSLNNRTDFVYVSEINDKETTSFIDKSIPYGDYLNYVILAQLRANPNSLIISNPKDINIRSRGSIELPHEIFYNSIDKQMVVFTKSKPSLSLYNLQSQLIKRVSIPVSSIAQQNYCIATLGIYNNQAEIYLPTDDKILIYSAKTLDFIGEIQTNGGPNVSVNYFDRKLIVSGGTPVLQTFDRATKQSIYKALGGNWETYRLFSTKNRTSNYINSFAISLHSIPVQLSVKYFNDAGDFLSSKDDNYHGTYNLNPNICKIAPNGMYFITDYSGAIYNYDMTFKTYLGQSASAQLFSDFEFSQNGNLIYAAMVREKSMNVYDQNLNLIKTIPLSAYPVKLLKGDNEIIVAVSSTPLQIGYSVGYSLEKLVTQLRFERVKME